MKTLSVETVIVIIIALVGAGGFAGMKYGSHQGFAEGYNKGQQVGMEDATRSQQTAASNWIDVMNENAQLKANNQKLVEDYNNLRDTAIRAVGASISRQYAPVTCNTNAYTYSSSYGTATTTCY